MLVHDQPSRVDAFPHRSHGYPYELLEPRPEPGGLSPLPTFDGGGALVDVTDHEALYQTMEGR